MAKQKSEFLSAFGTAMEVFRAIVNAVLERGGSDDDLRRILTSKKLAGAIADIIVGAKQAVENAFRLTVDYDLSVEDMVKFGKYDWANSDITSGHFPVARQGKSEVKAELVHLNRCFSSGDEVLNELDRLGYRPADLAEDLAFGAAYPEEQRKYPIVALGSVWQYPDGGRDVVYLGVRAGDRELDLRWLGDDWHEGWRFLAVRK